MSATPPSARERLLVAAAEMFERDGVHATGINAILARSGVAKDTLYKHFATKDDLVEEVVRRRDAQWCAWLRAGVEAASDEPAGRLLAVFDLLDSELRDPAYRGSVFVGATTDYPDPRHGVRRACIEHKTRVAEYLSGLARDAGLAEPDAMGWQLLLLIDGAICARTMRDARDAGRHAAQAAAVLIQTARR